MFLSDYVAHANKNGADYIEKGARMFAESIRIRMEHDAIAEARAAEVAKKYGLASPNYKGGVSSGRTDHMGSAVAAMDTVGSEKANEIIRSVHRALEQQMFNRESMNVGDPQTEDQREDEVVSRATNRWLPNAPP
jgi:hypothetical protein